MRHLGGGKVLVCMGVPGVIICKMLLCLFKDWKKPYVRTADNESVG